MKNLKARVQACNLKPTNCTSNLAQRYELLGTRPLLAHKGLLSKWVLASAFIIGNTIIINPALAGANDLPVIDKAYNANVSPAKHGNLSITSHQGKNNALLIWKSFDVKRGNLVEYKIDNAANHPGSVSFLNVVTGPGASHIDGIIMGINKTKSKVNFYLINPNGIKVSRNANITNMHNIYFGTSKVSQKLLDQFKNGSAPAIELNAMPNIKGMGKVTLIGDVISDNLKINGGQIVIADASHIVTTGKNKPIELHSSTNRIDVGGGKQDQATFEQLSGLKGVENKNLKANGSHEKGEYVNHFGQSAIYSLPSINNAYEGNNFDDLKNDLNGQYWLADDLVLDVNDRLIGDQAFTGSLDGAFHTIKLIGNVSKNAQSSDYGVLGKLDHAQVSNLKIMSDQLLIKDDLKGQKINLGALAGTIKDSSINNVEVVDFNYRFEQGLVHKDSSLGALAGKLEGSNTFSNVLSSFAQTNQDFLAQKKHLGELNHVGILVGANEGQIKSSLLVSGFNHDKSQGKLDSVGFGNNFGLSSDLNQSYNQALQALVAQGMNNEQALLEFNSHYALMTDGTNNNQVTALAHKGFLKPFFIEDFNFTYDGSSHDYLSLVNNEGFKLESLLTKNNGLNYEQKDAGNYGFTFETNAPNKELGHDFFFSYQYANETWDKSQGGSAALQDRTNRLDSLMGVGTLNINKKTIALELKDQVIAHDGKVNLEINRDTINNYDKLLASLAKGDKIDDLNLSLQVNGSHIGAIANSKNYEVIIKEATLTKKPAPAPIPVPTPDPKPQVPSEETHTNVIPQLNLNQALTTNKEPDNNVGTVNPPLVGAQGKCQNCSHYDNEHFTPLAWLKDNSYMNLSLLDYSQAVYASLPKQSINPQDQGSNNNGLLAYNNLSMSTNDDNNLIEDSLIGKHDWLNSLNQFALSIKSKAEYALSMLAKRGDEPEDESKRS